MESGFLILFSVVLASVLFCGFLVYKVIKSDQSYYDDLVKIFEEFIVWNNTISTKDAMNGFYVTLKETLNECRIRNFSMNITSEEFQKLSLEKLKELNKEALQDLIIKIKTS